MPVSFLLLLCLFVLRLFFAPLTVFLEFYFSLNFLAILPAPVVDAFALFACEFY